MKRFLLFCVAIIVAFSVQGNNIVVLLRPTSPVSFGAKDFWNLTVINNNAQAIEVTLETIVNFSTGQQAIRATSGTITLNPGTTVIDNSMLQTNSITYYSEQLKKADETVKTLLPGKYNYCIQLFSSNRTQLAQECAIVELTLLNPPVLVSLPDGTVTGNQYPSFNWVPPTPVFPDVQYDFKLVEVRDGQTKNDAILRNPVIYGEQGIPTPVLQYPTNAMGLQKGKSYAWQVQARTPGVYMEKQQNNSSLGISEVYLFTLKDSTPLVDTLRYHELKARLDGQVASLRDNLLYFIAKGYYTYNKALDYKVLNETNREVDVNIHRIEEDKLTEKNTSPESVYGENKYVLDITNINLTRGYYTLQVKDDKGTLYLLKFKVE